MNELKFDENLAVREVLDELLDMVSRREKLIRSAGQQAEKTRDERMGEHVKKLEGLMSDFLVLFDPVIEKVRRYGESLRESISESQAYLKSLAGIIDAGKTVEGSSATLQELEKDADGVQEDLGQSAETLDKIEDLLKRTKQYRKGSNGSSSEESSSRASASPGRVPAKSSGRQGSRSYLLPRSRLSSYEPSEGQH